MEEQSVPPAATTGATPGLVRAYEEGDSAALKRAKLSPERFAEIRRAAELHGEIGENLVVEHERRQLRLLGLRDLADKVQWVSRTAVNAGYDILSFDAAGDQKLIEVKSTSGAGLSFEVSLNEWRTALRTGARYWIYRVVKVTTAPEIKVFQDLRRMESEGRLVRSASGWKVRPL